MCAKWSKSNILKQLDLVILILQVVMMKMAMKESLILNTPRRRVSSNPCFETIMIHTGKRASKGRVSPEPKFSYWRSRICRAIYGRQWRRSCKINKAE